MSGPCLSCSTARNGSLSPNTLDLNTFVAANKELPIGLTPLKKNKQKKPTLFLHLSTYWFQQIPCTHDRNTHLSILFHPPLSSSQNLLFLLQPTRILPWWILYSRSGQPSSIKSQGVNILAAAAHAVPAATIQLCLLHRESCHMIHKWKLWLWSRKLYSPK